MLNSLVLDSHHFSTSPFLFIPQEQKGENKRLFGNCLQQNHHLFHSKFILYINTYTPYMETLLSSTSILKYLQFKSFLLYYLVNTQIIYLVSQINALSRQIRIFLKTLHHWIHMQRYSVIKLASKMKGKKRVYWLPAIHEIIIT